MVLASGWLAGCSHVLSSRALDQVDRGLSYTEVRADPEAYRGRTLLLGGMIVDNRSAADGTTLEVLRFFLDSWGRPDRPDEEGGRYLVQSADFLDPELYRKGRLVTLTGTVAGQQVRPLFGRDYRYPVFVPGEIHLWLEPTHADHGPNPYYDRYYGDPWRSYWGPPWYGPYWYGPSSFWYGGILR
jgi:outer membrane lipoprotein